MTANHGNEKLDLKLSEWNELVSDETQCMRLSQDDEIKFLSSRNKNCKSSNVPYALLGLVNDQKQWQST